MDDARKINLDSAERLMEGTLTAYYSHRDQHGYDQIADGIRKQFAGEKFMLEALAGRRAVVEILARLRGKGLKIPHCGDREADGSYLGFDGDADADF